MIIKNNIEIEEGDQVIIAIDPKIFSNWMGVQQLF